MNSDEEVLIDIGTVRVRIMKLQPNDMTPLHHHSKVTDNIFGLTGRMTIQLHDPDEMIKISPGTRCEIPPGRRHMVSNLDREQVATYLLVQGVGIYDFLTET